VNTVSDDFFNIIKKECGITWDDEDTKARLEEATSNGVAEFKDMFGKDINIEEYGLIRRIFIAYCKYYYYDQLEDFEKNYASEIINARMNYEVMYYGKETEG